MGKVGGPWELQGERLNLIIEIQPGPPQTVALVAEVYQPEHAQLLVAAPKLLALAIKIAETRPETMEKAPRLWLEQLVPDARAAITEAEKKP